MTSVAQFCKQAEEYKHTNCQAWVTAYIENPMGLGQESLTYVGCSKKISPEGCVPWFCRKRVGMEETALPEEFLNHCHSHDGDCSSFEGGIHCFALSVNVSDHSGSLKAEVWAPSMHVLGMTPNSWIVLDKVKQGKKLALAGSRPFELLLMSISIKGEISHFKVQFVKPAVYSPLTASLGELSAKFESISVVEDEDEHSICTSGVQFAPPARTKPVSEKLKEAISLLMDATEQNAKAMKLVQSILHDLL